MSIAVDIGIPNRVSTSSARCFTVGFTPKFKVAVFSISNHLLWLNCNAFVVTHQCKY